MLFSIFHSISMQYLFRSCLRLVLVIAALAPVAPSALFAQPVFSAVTPPNAIVGEVYPLYTFRASGAGSYALAPSSRPLPLGLSLSRLGRLEGRPTQVGTYNGIIIRASGSVGFSDSRQISIIVLPPTAPTLFRLATSFVATAATATSLPIGQANGFPPPTFALAPSSAPLPDGLRIADNRIIGLPRQGGVTNNIIVRASNPGGFVDSPPFSLSVQGQTARQAFGAPNTSLVFRQGFNAGVTSVVQQNGFYIAAGSFSSFDGRAVPPLIRISPEGRFDNTFSPRRADGTPLSINYVRTMKLQPDDKILVAGSFNGFIDATFEDEENEIYGDFVIRLLPEGMVDTTFKTIQFDAEIINDIDVQANGNIWVAGEFGGVGSLDSTGAFTRRSAPTPSIAGIHGIRKLKDGKTILFSREFGIFRYLPNGRRDTTFRSTFSNSTGFSEIYIWDVVEQANGNLFICATAPNDLYGPLVVCAVLNSSGRMIVPPSHFNTFFATMLEPDFPDEIEAKDNLYGARTALALPDGKLLLALHAANNFVLYRFNPDYTLDSTFTPSTGLPWGLGYNEIINNIQGMFFDTDFTACLFGNIRSYSGLEQIGMVRINTTAQLQGLAGQVPPTEAALGAPYPPFRFSAFAEPAPFYTLAKHSSRLPEGMTLSTTGVLSGVPTTTGVFSNIIVRAATGFVEQAFSTSFTITVVPPQAPTRFTAATPPVGLRGLPFINYQLQADGVPSPTFALAPSSPRLPRGITLSTNGVLSGLPAVQGLSGLVIRATNRFGFVDGQVNLRIDNPIPPTQFANEARPITRVGSAFAYPLNVNGAQPITYRLDTPTLPPGLTLSTNGIITGVAERSGTFPNITIRAENPTGDVSTTITITVLPRVQDFNRQGSFDTTFAQTSRPNAPITTIVRQPDGKFIIGGDFTALGSTQVGRIARLSSTGAFDSTFNEAALGTNFNGANAPILALARQDDGSLLVGGRFTQYNGAIRRCLVRISADGTLDNTFQIGMGFSHTSMTPEVRTIAVQSDGRIVVGGNFTSYNGRTCFSVVRLNADGTLDTDFHQNGSRGVDAAVNVVKLQSDGKIILAGAFTSFLMPSFLERRGIVRLNRDGSLDTSFRVIRGAASPGASFVSDVHVDRNDNLLIGGAFRQYEYTEVGSFASLDARGGLGLSSNIGGVGAFDAMIPNTIAFPTAIVRRSDGSGIVLGNFRRFNNEPRNGILALLQDGSLDGNTFGSFGFQNTSSGAFSGYPQAAVMEAGDNAVIVVGGFSHYDGTPQAGIVRIALPPSPIILPFAGNGKEQSSQTSAQNNISQSENATDRLQSDVEVAPNPFSDGTELRVNIGEQGFVSLVIMDALGRQVMVVNEGVLSKGEHRFRLSASQFSSAGVYRWRLQTASILKSGIISLVK
jgi:uncharacterized delta-60 repeat protein